MSSSTSWGGYVSLGGGVSVRAGWVLSYSPSTVSESTTSVTVTGTLRVQQSGAGFASGNDAWTVTGAHEASGTRSWSTSSSGATATIATFTKTVSLVYGTPQSFAVTGRVSGVGPTSSDAEADGSLTIPARPVSRPAPVTNLALTRVTDSRVDVTWTPNPSTSAPYDQIEVMREDVVAGVNSTIAVIGGSRTGFADTHVAPNRIYLYRVRPRNSAGAGLLAGPLEIRSRPATPAAPTVSRGEGGSVTVHRPTLSPVAQTWQVQHIAGGVRPGPLVATVSAATASWTHTPDPAVTHSYSVRANLQDEHLPSGWSAESATVQLIAAPLAPTPTGPKAADPAEGFHLTWRHNSVDGTPQRVYQVESRASEVDPWVAFTLQVTSSEGQHYVTPDAWSGSSRQWRVRTWGQHADPSPYSSTALLTLSARPVAGVVYPEVSHDSQRLTVRWSYYDPEGSVQAAWRATLLQGNAQLESRSGSGWSTSLRLNTALVDGAQYTVRVEVLDGAGLWSAPAESVFTVSYAPPATPVIEATWRKDDGYVVLAGHVPAPTGSQRPLDHVRIERASADGWVVVADDLPVEGAVTDPIPPTGTVVTYRAVAVSDIASEAYAETVVETSTPWVFINHGPGFGQVVRVWGNLQAGRSFSREKSLKRYAGRPFPVERTGTIRERTYNLSGVLFAPWAPPDLTSSYEDFEAAADAAAPVCVRDPEGVRLFVSTGSADLSDYPKAHRRVSMTMTQVDYTEQAT